MGEKPEMTPRTSQSHLRALSKALVLNAKVFFSTAHKSQGGRASLERIQAAVVIRSWVWGSCCRAPPHPQPQLSWKPEPH